MDALPTSPAAVSDREIGGPVSAWTDALESFVERPWLEGCLVGEKHGEHGQSPITTMVSSRYRK